MRKKLFFLCVMIFMAMTTFAQNSTQPQIVKVEVFLASLQANSRSSATPRVVTLLNDLTDAIYIKNGQVNTYGENPVSMYVDVANMGMASNPQLATSNVEIVTLKINSLSDLNQNMDFSVFSNYPNLKYIYILSTVATATPSAIISKVQNASGTYSIFYKIDAGS